MPAGSPAEVTYCENRKGKTLKIRLYFKTRENEQNAESRRSGYSASEIFGTHKYRICGNQHGVWRCESFRKMTYLNDGKWQNSRNYVIGVLVTIIMELLALDLEYII